MANRTSCLVTDSSSTHCSTAVPRQTFAFHEDHEGGVKLVGGQLFLEVKRPLPFNFIIGDAIVLITPPHRATLRREQTRKVRAMDQEEQPVCFPEAHLKLAQLNQGLWGSPCPAAGSPWEAYMLLLSEKRDPISWGYIIH